MPILCIGRKGWAAFCASPRAGSPECRLVERDASVHESAGVGVAVAQGDGEQAGRQQGAIDCDDSECHRRAVVGSRAHDGHALRYVVIRNGVDLRGLEVGSGIRIAVRLAFRTRATVVVMEVEGGFATLVAINVTIPVSSVAARLDAPGGFLLAREIRDRRARMVIRKGNVYEMVGVHGDLEEV